MSFLKIDIGSAPRVYVSKIRSRHDESPLLTTRSAPDENVDGEKKKKGKGRKKDKNKKGLGRKKNKNLENNQIGEDFEPTTQGKPPSIKSAIKKFLMNENKRFIIRQCKFSQSFSVKILTSS